MGEWMAPEVIEAMCYSQHADVYSVSMIVWECMTREELYAEVSYRTPYELMKLVSKSGIRPVIPEGIQSVLHNCWWAEVPGDRPSSAELERILEAALVGIESEEPLDTCSEDVERFSACGASSDTTQGASPQALKLTMGSESTL